jgi:hypothetical protein
VTLICVKPNLFIVGAPKCGTTAWVRYLRTHPGIFFADMKEPTYFATDLPGIRWVPTLAEYESLFDRGSGASVVAEASAMNLYSADSAEAIRRYNPDAKILIFLRPQEDFLQSYHHQLLFRFAETIEDFETAWRLSGNRPPETIPRTCREPRLLDYRAVASFREQVERYLDRFPAEQVRVFHLSDWAADPRAAYLQILDFLGLEDDGRTDFPRVKEAKSYRIQWLGRLIAHPPAFAVSLVRLLRKITGRSSLRLAESASLLISQRGYRLSISPQLREEIRSCYEADNRALKKRLAGLYQTD